MALAAKVAFAALFAITVTEAQAATAVCRGMGRDFSVETSVAAKCVAVAPLNAANISGNPANDPLFGELGANLRLLDESDDKTSGTSNGALSLTEAKTGLSGGFSIDLGKLIVPASKAYKTFVIAFKSGGNSSKGSIWAAFELPADVLGGTWQISGKNALSHVNLYAYETNAPTKNAMRPVAAVPVPASGVLLAAGLAGLGFLRRRRGRSA